MVDGTGERHIVGRGAELATDAPSELPRADLTGVDVVRRRPHGAPAPPLLHRQRLPQPHAVGVVRDDVVVAVALLVGGQRR